ncbi:uncharacterized protein LOC135489340 [Lineus longissimus]|uniref:uncharacterized protein LOC135489340 n=1 Tax=Lineus longissimus TaxID=88925 RepID=UPI00315C84B1
MELLDGCQGENATGEREEIQQRIVTCLLTQCLSLEDDTEKNPFVGVFPEMKNTFLFELTSACHLERSFVKVLTSFPETAALTSMRCDFIQHLSSDLDTTNVPRLCRAIHPLLPNAYLGPTSEVLLADLQASLEKILTALVKTDQLNTLQVYLSLCCLLEKCALGKGEKLLETEHRTDAVYTGIQRLHYGWDAEVPVINNDQLNNRQVTFLTVLFEKSEALFADVGNLQLSLENMRTVCDGIPGHANLYTVAVMLKTLVWVFRNVEGLSNSTLKGGENLATGLEGLHKSWSSILVKETEAIYRKCDLLTNVSLILDNKLPHCKTVMMDLIKVNDRALKTDPRWVDILEKHCHLLGNAEDLKTLLHEYVALAVLNHDLSERVRTVCRQLFCKLSVAKKDDLIHYALEHKIYIGEHSEFHNAATLVFNKLSSKVLSQSEAAWLALGNPEEFVRFAVENGIEHSGQGKVIAELFKSLPSVCKYDNLLTSEIKNAMQKTLPEKQQKNLIQFISHILLSKGNSVFCGRDFGVDVVLPLVNVEKIKSLSGLPFPFVMEILLHLIDVGSKSSKFPGDEERVPLLVCLADILDYCCVLWGGDRSGVELVEAKDNVLNCLVKIVGSPDFVLLDSERKWLEQAISDHCDSVKYLMNSCLSTSKVLTPPKELCKHPGLCPAERLSQLQRLIQFLMSMNAQGIQAFDYPKGRGIDYSELILVLSKILPHHLSQEWARCAMVLQRFYDNRLLVHPDYLDERVSSSLVVSSVLLDVVQVVTSSLQDVTYKPSMMNHVAKCYAVSIKELTEGCCDEIETLCAMLSHVCLVLYLLPSQVSDPLVVVALNTLQLIQTQFTQSTAKDEVETKLNPVFSVLQMSGERDDAKILIKKLKMFLKLYA